MAGFFEHGDEPSCFIRKINYFLLSKESSSFQEDLAP
jgi:hypothetical protein